MFHREAGVFKTSYAADMALYPLPIAKWAVAAFAGLFIVIAPLTLGEYYISILNLILIAVVGALGLNILVGYTGQISIGHGAFMSVGAYTAANLVTHLHAPFWITIPAGGLMAALIGAVVGIPSLRIKGINIFRYKLWAFAISSFYAGVTGVLYTYYLGIANYEQFQLTVSIDYLAMIIIGGLGSILGSIFGAIFVTLLPIATRWFLEDYGWLFFSQSDLLNAIPNLRLILFGGLIIFFLVVEPEGLNRLARTIRNHCRVWPSPYC